MIDSKTDNQTETDRQTHRQTHRHTDRERERDSLGAIFLVGGVVAVVLAIADGAGCDASGVSAGELLRSAPKAVGRGAAHFVAAAVLAIHHAVADGRLGGGGGGQRSDLGFPPSRDVKMMRTIQKYA